MAPYVGYKYPEEDCAVHKTRAMAAMRLDRLMLAAMLQEAARITLRESRCVADIAGLS